MNKWWKPSFKDRDCVVIGRVTYHKSSMPRVCKKCGYVFPGKKSDRFCSDVCRDLYRGDCAEKGRAVHKANLREKAAEKPVVRIKVFKPTRVKPENRKRPYAPRAPLPMAICPQCDVEFKPKYRKQKYCCVDCTKTAQAAGLMKVCPICGVTFKGDRRSTKYCSVQCRSVGTYHKVLPLEKFCVVCGKPFTPPNSKQQACSRDCGLKLRSLNKASV